MQKEFERYPNFSFVIETDDQGLISHEFTKKLRVDGEVLLAQQDVVSEEQDQSHVSSCSSGPGR